MDQVFDRGIALSKATMTVGAALVVLWMLVLALGLLGIYIADEYVTPAFSEHSVPPPRLY
jgi:hypothetical protein